MQTECPHCGQIYPDIDTAQLNQEVQCTACQNVFTVRPYHPEQSSPKSPAVKIPQSFGKSSGAAMKSLFGKEKKRYRATILAISLDIAGALTFVCGIIMFIMSMVERVRLYELAQKIGPQAIRPVDFTLPFAAIIGGLLIGAAGSGLRLLTQISDQLAEK